MYVIFEIRNEEEKKPLCNPRSKAESVRSVIITSDKIREVQKLVRCV